MAKLLGRLFYDVHQNLNWVRLTLLLAILFTSLVASILQSPPVVFMAALLLGAPLMSVVVGRFSSRGLSVTRIVPDAGTAGDVVSGDVEVENRSLWPAFLVQVRSGEVGAAPRSASASRPGDHAGESGTARDSAPIAALLAPTLDSLTASRDQPVLALGGDEHMTPLLRPGASMVWRQHWLLQRRGVYELPPAQAGAVDPLGLTSQLPARSRPDAIVVLPRPLKIDRLFFLGAASIGLQAPRHAASVTNAMDFHSVREWQPGEAIRRVHWKNTARTGKLHVVEWEEDTASDVALLLDTQATTRAGTALDNTLESAITIAASVAAYLLDNGYQFQLFHWFGAPAQVRRVDARSSRHLGTVLRELAQITPVDDPAASLPALAQAAIPLIPAGRSALVVASTRADIQGALRVLASLERSGSTAHALALDAASYEAGTRTATGPRAYGRSSANVRVVRHGESLAAALDQLA